MQKSKINMQWKKCGKCKLGYYKKLIYNSNVVMCVYCGHSIGLTIEYDGDEVKLNQIKRKVLDNETY